MLNYNQQFTANRLVVEDVFGWLKERACVLDGTFGSLRDKQDPVFYAACKLHNFTHMIHINYVLQQCQR